MKYKLEKIHATYAGINEPETDFRAEVVAASLLQYKIEAEKIFLRRMGINNRARNKDIIRLKREVFNFSEEHIVIETNRESIYNYLPEGIFHPPTLGGPGKTTEDIIDQIRIQQKTEEDAKKFFVPFELETYYTELAALDFENRIDQKGGNDHLLDVLSDLWPLLAELDNESAKIFIYLLPFFHSVRGNKIWFEKCMTAFLDLPVVVSFTENRVEEAGNIELLFLSGTRLGIDSLLCGSHTDGNRNWQINIGPVPPAQLYNYIPGSRFNVVLQAIYNYCLPATAVWQQHCVTAKADNEFVLLPVKNGNIYLGYNTFL